MRTPSNPTVHRQAGDRRSSGVRRWQLAVVTATLLAVTALAPAQVLTPRRALQRGAPVWNNAWARGAVFYEVFVRSFADSDGDGKGDLKGLIAKLDYLNTGDSESSGDLKVDGLWLMPIFASPSYHGYDTIDYEHINPDYGTDADFELLCREAHRRGLRIILDLVVNHTGSGHPWFQASSSSPTSPRRDWYVWRADDPGWTQPWGGTSHTWHKNPNGDGYYYGVFWSGMPDLNLRNPAVRAEIKRIAKLWLDRGADGFRLDAARHLVENGAGQLQVDQPETHAFWQEFAAYVKAVRSDAVLVGENWTDTRLIATYFGTPVKPTGGDELPMNFDFPLAEQILKSVNAGNATGIAATLRDVGASYPAGVMDATFLTNHDQVRLATQLGGDTGKQRLAAAVLLTLPGSPFLYYGEEIGVPNGGADRDDRLKRTPMPWDASGAGGFTAGTPWFPLAADHERNNVASESADPSSLLSRYRNLIRLRRGSVALRAGEISVLASPTAASPLLVFVRQAGTERVLVAHNLAAAGATGGPYAIAADGVAGTLLADAGVSTPTGQPGAWKISLPARSTGVWRLP